MKYSCDQCQRDVGRDNLLVKKVSYHEMGKGGRMVKQRTVSWLCRDSCIPRESAWRQKPMKVQSEKQKSPLLESESTS